MWNQWGLWHRRTSVRRRRRDSETTIGFTLNRDRTRTALALAGVALVSGLVSGCGQTVSSRETAESPTPTAATSAECAPRPGEYSAGYLQSVYRTVTPIFETAGQGISIGAQAVDLDLSTGQEELAALVEDHFGDAVQLTVAGVAYCRGPGRSAACPVLTQRSPLPDGLRLSLSLKSKEINPTEALSGTLTVRWSGPGLFRMDVGQPLLADIVKEGTLTVRGVATVNIAGTGFNLDLAPGQSRHIPVVVGTSRCGSTLGSALPTGRYDARVDLQSERPGDHRHYLAPPAPVNIQA